MTEWIAMTKADGRTVHVRAAAIDLVEEMGARTHVFVAHQILVVTETIADILALIGVRTR